MTHFFVLLYLFFPHSLLNEWDLGVFCLLFWLVACFFVLVFFSGSHFVRLIFASSKREGKGALSKTRGGEGFIFSMVLHCCVEDSHLPVPVVPDVFK